MREEIKTDDEIFGYFNTDINLLVLHILMEGFYRKQSVFTLDQFIKGDYWKIEEIQEELQDANDFGSAEEMVAHQVLRIIEDFKIGKVKRVSVTDLRGLMERVVREAVQVKNGSDEDVGYYAFVIDQIYNLRKLKDAQDEKLRKNNTPYDSIAYKRLDFSADEFGGYLDGITKLSAPHIEIEVAFNNEQMKIVREAIKAYITCFSEDGYIDMGPDYKAERLYFSSQLENFYDFVKDLPVINDSVNIPFSSLTEPGFEVIKVLSFLEMQKRIQIRNWNDTQVWNVKFHQTPITLQSLISDQTTANVTNLKGNLSFDEAKSILLIGDKIVKIRNKSDQYHLLRIMFKNKEDIAKEWFYSEIAEKYDNQADLGDKKFYNAAYQANLKIIRDTGLRDVLITTNQSVRINPKYLNKT